MNSQDLLIKGKKIEEYLAEILSVEEEFNTDMENSNIYSQETIDALAQYYFKSFISNNPRLKFPKICSYKPTALYYYYFDKAPFDRQIGSVFIKTGNLVRDFIQEKGIICPKIYNEILPIMAEMKTYEDLSIRLDDSQIKEQGLAYQLNKVRSAAIDLFELDKLPIDIKQKYQVKRRAEFDRMIIVSHAFASVLYESQTNEEISKKIKRIITKKESLDKLLMESKIDYNDARLEEQLARQLNYLQFPMQNFVK